MGDLDLVVGRVRRGLFEEVTLGLRSERQATGYAK